MPVPKIIYEIYLKKVYIQERKNQEKEYILSEKYIHTLIICVTKINLVKK